MYKLALKFCALLLFGALVSLIQTWWVIHFYENTSRSPLRPNFMRYPFTQPYDTWKSSWVVVDRRSQDLLVSVARNRDGRVFQVRSSQIIQTDPNQTRRDFDVPSWSFVAHEHLEFNGYEDEIVLEQANGWPFIAWKGKYIYDPVALRSRWSWSIPDDRQDGMHAYRRVILFPYQPHVPGVVLNAAFYGIVSYSVVFVLRHASRRIIHRYRLFKGKCPNCAYDTRGLTICPECGEDVQNAVRKT